MSRRVLLSAALLFVAAFFVSQAIEPRVGSAQEREIAGRTREAWALDLTSASEVVRLRATRMLPQFGVSSTGELLRALKDESAAVRYVAAAALGDLEVSEANVQSALERLKTDPSESVRLSAAYALWQRSADPASVKVLLDQLKSPNRGLSCSAVDFVARLKISPALPREDVVRALQQALTLNDEYVPRTARTALRRFEQP